MNLIDVLGILILLLCIISGIRRGFILSGSEFLCWAGSIVLSIWLYRPVERIFHEALSPLGSWSAPVIFFLIFILARILFGIIAQHLIAKMGERIHHQRANKVLGIIPGAINGFLFLAVLSVLLPFTQFYPKTDENGRQGQIRKFVTEKTRWLASYLSPVFSQLPNDPGIATPSGKQQLVKLPFSLENPTRRPDLEARMLEMVNQERTSRGLNSLKADPEIAVAALKHSADMFARGYFSHMTPEGKNPFQRIKDENVSFFIAGENLALAQTLELAHKGLMKSPGHRANILRPAFGRLGIGILDGGIYGLMITQNFRN